MSLGNAAGELQLAVLRPLAVHEGPFDVFGQGGLAEQTKDLALLTDV
jgi:hypothetical protein